jgi:hypothetical protein
LFPALAKAQKLRNVRVDYKLRVMRTTTIALSLLCILAGVATTNAGERAKGRRPEKMAPSMDAKTGIQREQNVELTGSRIKKAVRRSGQITDGSSQVVVIDRTSIERSGGADLMQVLTLRGVR